MWRTGREPLGVILVVVSLGACSGSGPTSNGTMPPAVNTPSLAVSVAALSGSDGYGGTGYSFAPATVAVLLNGTVTWSNSSGDAHTVTFDGASYPLSNGAMYVRTFNTVGDHSYTCSIHAGMSGVVRVVAP